MFLRLIKTDFLPSSLLLPPTNNTKLRSVLGALEYYSRLIPSFSNRANCLFNYLLQLHFFGLMNMRYVSEVFSISWNPTLCNTFQSMSTYSCHHRCFTDWNCCNSRTNDEPVCVYLAEWVTRNKGMLKPNARLSLCTGLLLVSTNTCSVLIHHRYRPWSLELHL